MKTAWAKHPASWKVCQCSVCATHACLVLLLLLLLLLAHLVHKGVTLSWRSGGSVSEATTSVGQLQAKAYSTTASTSAETLITQQALQQ
jgi:hypothetical protein